MKDLMLIETNNNLKVQDRDLTFTDDTSKYVAQKLRIRLSFFLGEWYLNVLKGIPYYEEILIKNPNLNYIEDLLKSEIVVLDEVEQLLNFNLVYEGTTRTLSVEFTAQLIDGSTVSINI